MRIQEMFVPNEWNRFGQARDGFDIALGRLPRPVENAVWPTLPDKDQLPQPNDPVYALGWGMGCEETQSTCVTKRMNKLRMATKLKIVDNKNCPGGLKQYMKPHMICAYAKNEDACKGGHVIMSMCVPETDVFLKGPIWCVLEGIDRQFLHQWYLFHFDATEKQGAHDFQELQDLWLNFHLFIFLGDSGGPILVPDDRDGEVENGDPRNDLILGITSFGNPCKKKGGAAVYTRVNDFLPWIHSILSTTGMCISQVPTDWESHAHRTMCETDTYVWTILRADICDAQHICLVV